MCVNIDQVTAAKVESEVPAPAPKKRGGGARTPEGRDRAKRNSLKHGRSAREIFPEPMADAIARLEAVIAEQFKPATTYEFRLVSLMSKAWARLDDCQAQKLLDRQRQMDRAGVCWDDDRRREAEVLGGRLAKDSTRVSSALRRTKQGVDYLIERWDELEEVLESQGSWTEEQRQIAFDLLGTRPELRTGSPRVPAGDNAPALRALVAAEVATLQTRLDAFLLDLDEGAQAMAMVGMPGPEDTTTRLLSRYENQARRDLIWAREELERVRAGQPPRATLDDLSRRAGITTSPRAEQPPPPIPSPVTTPTPTHRTDPVDTLSLAPPSKAADLAPPEPTRIQPSTQVTSPRPAAVPATSAPLNPRPSLSSAFKPHTPPANRRQRRAQKARARQAQRAVK